MSYLPGATYNPPTSHAQINHPNMIKELQARINQLLVDNGRLADLYAQNEIEKSQSHSMVESKMKLVEEKWMQSMKERITEQVLVFQKDISVLKRSNIDLASENSRLKTS